MKNNNLCCSLAEPPPTAKRSHGMLAILYEMATRKRWGDWCVGGGCGGQHVVTARQFILSKIDTLRSAASPARGDATAKEGHVNYDVSDVPVEAQAAPMTGSGCATTCCQIFFFGSVRTLCWQLCEPPPPHAIEDRRPDVWSLGRGMGVLGWGGYLALSQGGATDGKRDSLCHHRECFLWLWVNFHPLGAPNSQYQQGSGTHK